MLVELFTDYSSMENWCTLEIAIITAGIFFRSHIDSIDLESSVFLSDIKHINEVTIKSTITQHN